LIDSKLASSRERYQQLLDDPAYVEGVLKKGAQRAREYSVPLMEKVRSGVGIRALG